MWLNVWGYQTKNLDAVKLSVHPNSPVISQIEVYTQQVFEHELNYEILSMEVLEEKSQEAKLKMTMITRAKTPTPHFRDNLWTGFQYLYRDDLGNWKIWAGETVELKYL
jgi:hypothetical protein